MFVDKLEKVDLGAGGRLEVPEGEEYGAAAERLTRVLAKAGGELKVNAGEGTVVALGNMMDNPFIRRLYFGSWDATDLSWPGPGGYVLRAVSPGIAGERPALILGVSEERDICEGVDLLCEIVREEGLSLSWPHRVKLGRWGDLYRAEAERFLADPEERLEDTGGSGDWDYMMLIARMGMSAFKTECEELIPRFSREILRFAQVRFFERERQDPIMIHGFLRHMLLPFALLEHHPVLDAELRLQVLDAFLALFRSTEGAQNPRLLEDIEHWRVRQNHSTRSAVDLYFGGLYFHQIHGLEEGKEWMGLTDRFFAPQLTSSKPVCDSWGHQWAASLYNTADYALMAEKEEYLESEVFHQGVERAVLAHSNLETGPLLYFLMVAVVSGREEYLALVRTVDADDLIERAVKGLGHDEPGRAWATGKSGGDSDRLLGLQVAPLARLFYDSIENYEAYAPPGVYRSDVPFEQTFDKISLRTGWEGGDDYLLLDGISGGSHSYQDGNCLVRFTSRGKNWFTGPRYGMLSTASVRRYNGVSVCCDGRGPGCESRYARLLYRFSGEEAEGCGTSMVYPEQSEWRRHLIRSGDGWHLVVDEVVASCGGCFLAEGRWHVGGEVEIAPGKLVARQENERLVMLQAGSGWEENESVYSGAEEVATCWTLRMLQNLEMGQKVRWATLFWTEGAGEEREIRLQEEECGYRIAEGERELLVELAEKVDEVRQEKGQLVLADSGGETVRVTARRIAIGGKMEPVWEHQGTSAVSAIVFSGDRCWVGHEDGRIGIYDRDGTETGSIEGSGPVRGIAPLADGGWVSGGDDAVVRRFNSDGRELWAHEIEWKPMNWEYWTRLHCGLLSLQAGDMDGDGRVEIVAGCADRHLYAWREDGEFLWRTACEWGTPVCMALARVDEGEELQVLVGMADPAIHGWCRVYGADGGFRRALQRPDIVCWSIPSWMQVLRRCDLDGDGWEEVITGLDTSHRQLIVYRREGEIAWEADLGGGVTVVEVGSGAICAGTEGGYVQCFTFDGRRSWQVFLEGEIAGLAPTEDGRVLVAAGDGRMWRLDEKGKLLEDRAGSPVKAVAFWPNVGLLVGRIDGRIELCE